MIQKIVIHSNQQEMSLMLPFFTKPVMVVSLDATVGQPSTWEKHKLKRIFIMFEFTLRFESCPEKIK